MFIYFKLFYTALFSNLVLPLSSESFLQTAMMLNSNISVWFAFFSSLFGGFVGFLINYEVVFFLYHRNQDINESKLKMNQNYDKIMKDYLFPLGLLAYFNPNIASLLMIIFALTGKRQWRFIFFSLVGYALYLNKFANLFHL